MPLQTFIVGRHYRKIAESGESDTNPVATEEQNVYVAVSLDIEPLPPCNLINVKTGARFYLDNQPSFTMDGRNGRKHTAFQASSMFIFHECTIEVETFDFVHNDHNSG